VLDEDPDAHRDDEGHEADGDHVVRDGDALVRVVPPEHVDLLGKDKALRYRIENLSIFSH